MGNQMPARCMAPCNPVCCAICCDHVTGRENDTEHKTGSIFANAASVLSMAAEEISLDDHLEKELANEVELWRMETSSTAVHTNDGAYRTVFAAIGQGGHGGGAHSIDSSSALSSPNGGIESDMDDVTESLGESLRGDRGRTDFAYSGGRRRVASDAKGQREGTGLSTESSGMRQSLSTSALSPEETATSSLPNGGAATATSSSPATGEDTRSGDVALVAGTVPFQPPQSAKVKERLSMGASRAGGSNTPGTGGAGAVDAAGTGHRENSGVPSPREGTASRSEGAVPDDGPPDDTAASVPMREGSPVGWFQPLGPEGPNAVPETDQALPTELSSFSSSEEDSFPGFIEDPLEREMQEEAPSSDVNILHYASPGAWAPDSEGTSQGRSGQLREQGVRADRSAF